MKMITFMPSIIPVIVCYSESILVGGGLYNFRCRLFRTKGKLYNLSKKYLPLDPAAVWPVAAEAAEADVGGAHGEAGGEVGVETGVVAALDDGDGVGEEGGDGADLHLRLN